MPTLAQLMSLLEVDPDDAFVLYGVAMEHAKLGDHGTALTFFDRSIAADAANPYHYFHKARSLEALDRAGDALATFREGLEQAKASGDAKAISEICSEIDRLR